MKRNAFVAAAFAAAVTLGAGCASVGGSSGGHSPAPRANNPAENRIERLSTRDEVRFIILADTQFANRDVFERMAHEIEMLRPEFVIQAGDLIQGYTHNHEQARTEWWEFRGQIEPITAPFFPVPGNHDVLTPETREVYEEEWGPNRFNYMFEVGNVLMVSIDTWHPDEGDRVGAWQREWLAEELAAYAERAGDDLRHRAIFVLTHSPLWRYASDHEGRQQWEQVHAILRDYPVQLVVGGHTHEYVWEEKDGINYIVINSSGHSRAMGSERAGELHAFLHVSVLPDGDTRYGLMRAGSVLPLDTIDNEERARNPKFHISGGTLRTTEWEAGAPLDTELALPLENETDVERTFELRWDVPRGAEVEVEPAREWVTLAPGESTEQRFRLVSTQAPGRDALPSLRVSSEQRLRSGVVSRQWEEIYRKREEQADPAVYPTRIPLEDTYTFAGRYSVFLPPVGRVARMDGEIVLDGRIDEEAWDAAHVLDELWVGTGRPAPTRAELRLLYDEDYLYVAGWMEEPNPAGLVANAAGSIPFTWDDDDFELFFDIDETQRDYHRLFQNVAGTRFSSRPRHIREEERYFQPEYESAIHIGEDYWSIEMIVPWSDLDLDGAPEPGERWSFIWGRHRQQDPQPRQHWSADGSGGLYAPARYGVLFFE